MVNVHATIQGEISIAPVQITERMTHAIVVSILRWEKLNPQMGEKPIT